LDVPTLDICCLAKNLLYCVHCHAAKFTSATRDLLFFEESVNVPEFDAEFFVESSFFWYKFMSFNFLDIKRNQISLFLTFDFNIHTPNRSLEPWTFLVETSASCF